MTPNLYPIPGPWAGRLAITARPRGGDWLRDDLAGLRAARIDVLVSLLESEEAARLALESEAESAGSEGLRLLRLEVPDRSIPPSTPAAADLVHAIAQDLRAGRSVAIHCRQGIGRSGLIAAAVLIDAGLDPERAIVQVSDARGLSIPETPEQRAWILRFAAALPAQEPLQLR